MTDHIESQSEKYTFQELKNIDSLGQLVNFVRDLETETKTKKWIDGSFFNKNGMVGRVTATDLNDLIFKMRDNGERPDLTGSINFLGSNFQVSEIWDKVEELSIKNKEK